MRFELTSPSLHISAFTQYAPQWCLGACMCSCIPEFIFTLTLVALNAGKVCEVLLFSNSNWSKWRTIQGLIAQVISTSHMHAAQGRFENYQWDYSLNCKTTVKWSIIILPITNFEIKKSLENLFISEKVCSTFHKYYKLQQTWRRKPFNLMQLMYPITGKLYPIMKIEIEYL